MSVGRGTLNPVGTPAAFGDPPLTARPEGLLSLLGIQSGGKYPQTLSPTLVPTFELSGWLLEYTQQFQTSLAFNLFTAPVGTKFEIGQGGAPLQVPDGEIWILTRAGISVAPTYSTAGVANWTLIRTNNAAESELHLDRWQGTVNTTAGTSRVDLGSGINLPVVLRPTVKLMLQWSGGTAVLNSGSGEANVSFARCRI